MSSVEFRTLRNATTGWGTGTVRQLFGEVDGVQVVSLDDAGLGELGR